MGLSLTPTTSTRVAPKCSAGLIGATWRTAPSPKYSRLTLTGGKISGIAALASKCSSARRVGTPTRRWRNQGSMVRAPLIEGHRLTAFVTKGGDGHRAQLAMAHGGGICR